jgi:crotonobetainyl-CoA:carnitine CoA-transferase CaiB-like acyl-CoA transferase
MSINNKAQRSGPLAGLKVVDLTHVMAGPTCTLMLADMGADVIKIEKSPNGDDTRHSVPPKIGDEAASFLMMNRNKRGIVLDLKTAGGKAVLRRLIAGADVLVENFAPGAMERLGFGYEDLHADFPALIYCSLSGFGRTGPYKHRRGFDLVAQAMSGIMSFTGERPDGPPVKCGPPLSDITAGLLASMGILAAYSHRLKTGEGQWVETSLYEAALIQAFEASDGWLVVGGANRKHWLLMLEALGALELAADPRFVNGSDRMAHLKELEAELSARFRKQNRAHWLAALDDKGVPCGPVHDMLEALNDPQTLAREMVVEVEHSTLGPVKTIGLPVKFSATPGKVRSGAPVYGEHTREVLREYGFDQTQIEAFEKEGAIVAASTTRKEQIA